MSSAASMVRLRPALEESCRVLGLVPVPRGSFMDSTEVDAALAPLDQYDRIRVRNNLRVAGQLNDGRHAAN